MTSNDPDFETKAADLIGLRLNAPQHAAVFSVDEKTAIQALGRKDRMLPQSQGRAESHGLECRRNGTLSLFATLINTIKKADAVHAPIQQRRQMKMHRSDSPHWRQFFSFTGLGDSTCV